MSKKSERIEDLKAVQNHLEGSLREANERFDALNRQVEAVDRANTRMKEQKREDAKLANISNGLIPVDDLRALVQSTKTTKGWDPESLSASIVNTAIELRIVSPNPIQKAIVDALTKETPKFADGGYVGPSAGGDFTIGRTTQVVELSPFDRQSLADAVKLLGRAQ